ncbi:cell wall-binding repeat-containing protein [Embleya sp. NBC_00896]|uniref:cell wall-binding repeat-containing protein n=1 Tax=Embleya sp. NBC_00896 TaxID=2975961 RepID=UPI002F91A678|nr:cell wall-binding repeat-containing protein [Embleya sp. NBC_00896]
MKPRRLITAIVSAASVALGTVALSSPAGAADAGSVLRLSGWNAVATSAAVSQASYNDGEAEAVVLTRVDHFGDGLVAAPLAVAKKAPLLLTETRSLSPEAEEELKRVLPQGKSVYILGGELALSENVENRVEALGYNVVRIGGASQYETAINIANAANTSPKYIFLATGREYYDALAAGASASLDGSVVVLTDGSNLPDSVRDYLDQHPGSELVTVGTPAEDALAYHYNREFYTFAGDDAIDTSLAVASWLETPGNASIATMNTYHDAMAGSALSGLIGAPVLLSNGDELDSRVAAWIATNRSTLNNALLYGGTMALSDRVFTDTESALGVGGDAKSQRTAPQAPSLTAPKDKGDRLSKFPKRAPATAVTR